MSYDREVLLKDCVRVSEAARCAGLRLEGKLKEILHELHGSHITRHGYIYASDDKAFLRATHPGLSEETLSHFDAAFTDVMKVGARELLGDPSPLTRLSEAAEALREALGGGRGGDLVTLAQAAGMVHRAKRSLERYKSKGLPMPTVDGGGGRPDLWDWAVLRPWLEEEFGFRLPATFPARRGS